MNTELTIKQDLAAKSDGIVEQAQALVVETQEDAERASFLRQQAKALIKAIEDDCRPQIDAAYRLHKSLKAQMDKYTEAPRRAIEVIDKAIKAYADAEAARRREQARIEEEKRKKEIEELEASGLGAFASALDTPMSPPEKVVIAGASLATYWSARVVNIKALCRAVVDGVVSEEAVAPNMPYLNEKARALKAELAIPGVEAVAEQRVRG